MIFIDEMKNLKVYKRQVFLPYNDNDKKHDSLVYLLTPNYLSSRELMNNPLLINRKYFESYYMERNVSFYINSKASKKALEEYASLTSVDESDNEFAEYHISKVDPETISESANVIQYYGSISEALKENRMEPGEYNVYVHELYSNNPDYIGRINVNLFEYTDYKASYEWIEKEPYEIVDENLVISGKDIMYNKDKFESGEINLCFITGLSGSGKSTMAKGHKNVEIYELDDVFANQNFSDANLKEYGDLIYSFFNGPGKKYRSTEHQYDDAWEKGCFNAFINYAKSYATSHKNKKFIIEGVELYWFAKPEDFKKYAVYIKGTSALKSMHRSAWRDSSDAESKGERIKAYAKNMIRKDRAHAYGDADKVLEKWRSYYTSLSESVAVTTDAKPIKRWGIVSDDGAYNACCLIPGYEKPCRERAAMIIFNDKGEIFGKMIKDGNHISLPGGGLNPGEDPADAAVREAKEECRMLVKNVRYAGTMIEYEEEAQDWVKQHVKDENDWWYGYYSYIYIGELNGTYEGHIDDIDKDDTIEKGKWWSIEDAWNYIDDGYKDAISQHLSEGVTFTTTVPKNNSDVRWIPIDNQVIKTYKDKLKGLSHVRTSPSDHGYLFLDKDNNPIGFVSLEDKSGDKWIQALEIAPDFQRSGYGTNLLQFAQKQGAKFLSVNKSNDVALHMCEKQGWKITGGTDHMHFTIHEEGDVTAPIINIPDVAGDLKNMARTIKMRAKKGLYKMNKQRRELERSVLTADDITAQITRAADPSSTPSTNTDNTNEIASYIHSDDKTVFIMDESAIVLDEANAAFDVRLKNVLYNSRMRTKKDQLVLLNKVKAENKFIKYAYPDNMNRYANRNLFYDLSYYLEVYFRNANIYKLQKGLALFAEFLERLLDPKKVPTSYTKKAVFIPVKDWNINPGTRAWLYRESINPLSMIYAMLVNNDIAKLKTIFGKMDIVFFTPESYFKINFGTITEQELKIIKQRYKSIISKMLSNAQFSEDEVDYKPDVESTKVIVTNITDKLEKNRGINMSTQSELIGKINDKNVVKFAATGIPVKTGASTYKASTLDGTAKKKADEIVSSTSSKAAPKEEVENKQKEQEAIERKKVKVIGAITQTAKKSKNTDDAIEALDSFNDEDFKQAIMDLELEDNETKISSARSARMMHLNAKFEEKELKGVKVKDLIDADTRKEEVSAPLVATTIPVDSPFQDQWSDLKFMNFDKKYDVNKDIMRMLTELSKKQFPLAVRDITITDNSTSEDFVDLYKIELEDFRGKRYTVNLDVPKFKDGKYLILRGNKKTIQNQYFNMPIIKTEVDTVQVISNYSKIFIRRFGNTTGKTVASCDRLLKALNKYDGKEIKVVYGDNKKVSKNFEAPIDYIDIGSVYSKISYNGFTYYFNQDEFKAEYKDKMKNPDSFYYGVNSDGELISYEGYDKEITLSGFIGNVLCGDKRFEEIFNNVSVGKKHIYSKASIMNAEIPLIVVCALSEGLTTVLQKANVEYQLMEKLSPEYRRNREYDYIKFTDGYLVYRDTYSSSLLLNGLKEINPEEYSIDDIDTKRIWIESLDNFGGRLKADGLENFYECMIDPITFEVLEHYKLPTDYVNILIYSNNLLADTKYISHGDSSSRRLRRNELIAVKVYKTLFNDAYGTYSYMIRHNPNAATFSVKQSAVIDKFLLDPTASDLSIINGLNDIENCNAVATKGESGMNSERSYTLDKRTYDESMLNILGLSTGFANNVGVTRQATLDANVDTERGYVKSINGDTSKMNDAKSLTATEALSPMGSTHDDPLRTGMTFIQTAKHQVRTEKSDPLLVTNGADEVIPYMVTDIFCKKANEDGKVVEFVPDKYMVVKYKSGNHEYVDLSERIEKNSDGGFYVNTTLITDLKEGSTFKANQILAYEKDSFSKGKLGESNKLSYNVGKLMKIAVVNSDDNFEDSALVTTKLAEDLATNIIMKEERLLSKDTNIYNMVSIGQKVNQEDVLFETQTTYDDEDINILLKNLAGDEEQISKLGRRPIKSPTAGEIAGISLYRTCEIEEMSESLQRLFKAYEKDAKKQAAHLKKDYGIDDPTLLPSIGKLKPTGKMKNAPNSVLIEIYIRYHDIVGVGETVQFISAYSVMSAFSRVKCR